MVRIEQADGNHNNLDVLPETGGIPIPDPPTNGVSGYVVADISNIPDWLSMNDNGGYCTVVAFFRNLYMQGIEVLKEDFDKVMQYFREKHPKGQININEIAEYMKGHVSETQDFMWWDQAMDWFKDWQSDKAGAEKFLLELAHQHAS